MIVLWLGANDAGLFERVSKVMRLGNSIERRRAESIRASVVSRFKRYGEERGL